MFSLDVNFLFFLIKQINYYWFIILAWKLWFLFNVVTIYYP